MQCAASPGLWTVNNPRVVSNRVFDSEDTRLGFYLGAGAQSSNERGPDAVHNADRRTVRHLGSRVAKLG